MPLSIINQSSNPSIYTDINSLNGIRQQAQVDAPAAIKAAAKEFEAFFMNMMLKSMRQASEVLGEDSIFNSNEEKMFIGMLDEQMSVELSQKGNLGIADLMTKSILGNRYQSDQNFKSNLADPIIGIERSTQTSTDANMLSKKMNKLATSIPITESNDSNTKFGSEGNQPTSDTIESVKKIVSSNIQVPEKKSLFNNSVDFIERLMPLAEKAAKSIGVDAKLLLSQAALESGWGKYIMHDGKGKPSYNLFGIKANNWSGEKLKIDTLEVKNGEFVKQKDEFRVYDGFEQSFADYAEFLQSNPRYQQALSLVKDAKQFMKSLQSAGYATDPNYANKVLSIFNRTLNQPSIVEQEK